MDDVYPVTKAGKLMFSEAGVSNNVWGVVLEKAWSKLNVNYERTCAGW